jgi:hypothetical protein
MLNTKFITSKHRKEKFPIRLFLGDLEEIQKALADPIKWINFYKLPLIYIYIYTYILTLLDTSFTRPVRFYVYYSLIDYIIWLSTPLSNLYYL